MSEYLDLPLSSLRESPTNPRKHFDPAKLAELTKSIEYQGIVQPLVVRQCDGFSEVLLEKKTYEIIAGARRYRAAKAAGLQAVPCRVMDLNDRQALEVQQIENLQREDIHPLEEAAGYRVMLTQLDYTVADIAAKVGKDESYIYRRLKLTDLIPEAQAACWEDTVTPAMAAILARLTPADQKTALEAILGRDWLRTAKELNSWIQREMMLELKRAPWLKADENLVPGAVPCAVCPKNTGCSPALFPEIEDGDTCTDKTCYRAKEAAFVARRKAELEEKDPGLRIVSGGWNPYGQKAEVPGREAYTELTAKEAKAREDAQKVLVVDGEKAGQTIYVAFDRGRSGGIQKTDAEKKAEAKRRAEEKLQAEILKRQVFAVVDAAEQSAEIRGNTLRFIAQRVWDRWSNDARRMITKRRGGEVDFASMTDEQFTGLLIECCLIDYSDYGDKRLQEAAELLEIELEPIAAAARLEAKEKAKPKGKAAESAPAEPAPPEGKLAKKAARKAASKKPAANKSVAKKKPTKKGKK